MTCWQKCPSVITDADRKARSDKPLTQFMQDNKYKALSSLLDEELDDIIEGYIKIIRAYYMVDGQVSQILCEFPKKYRDLARNDNGDPSWWRKRRLLRKITKRLSAKTGTKCKMYFVTSYGSYNIRARIQFSPAIT